MAKPFSLKIFFIFFGIQNKNFPLNPIDGFRANSEIDPIIQFWINYWRSQGLKFPEIDPLIIKSLIAIESGFNPMAKSKVVGSSAFGLMQVTNQTLRILSGSPNEDGLIELPSPFVRSSQSDIADPVVNIAAGTRWLFQKYSKIPSRADKNAFNTIKNYHSWNQAGEEYATSVMDLYKKSK